MYIMNLIHDICLTKNHINNTPRWKFISKNKQTKKLDNNISNFLNLDIFASSENMISFLLSLGEQITKNINGYLFYDDACMCIEVVDDGVNIRVEYYPRSNRFEIKSDYLAYSIYRNTKICNHIRKIWEPLTIKIKERYIEIIIQMAEYISMGP